MCLAIPMRIEQIDGLSARCQARGIYREVSLFLMQESLPDIGDYVLVHVGYAIQKVAADEALKSWSLYDQIVEEA